MRVLPGDLQRKKLNKIPIAMLTAYDANVARVIDRSTVDIILVGDSLGNTALGYSDTVPVTMDDMVHHTIVVSRVTDRAMIVADMPFLSYQGKWGEAFGHARKLLQSGATAVKCEISNMNQCKRVRKLVEAGVPVMGHIGFTPQSISQLDGYRIQGKTDQAAQELREIAVEVEAAGVFAIVIEMCIPDVAGAIRRAASVPIIGIGAGDDVDGQVLVTDDVLGWSERPPKFAKQYVNFRELAQAAFDRFVGDVTQRGI